MLEAIDTMARVIGYAALLLLLGWCIKNLRNDDVVFQPEFVDDEIDPSKVVRPLVNLRNQLEGETRAISTWGYTFERERYDLTLEKRPDHIDCFVEDCSTRTAGTGTGKFAHVKLKAEDLESIGRWAATTADEHRASVARFRDMSDARRADRES